MPKEKMGARQYFVTRAPFSHCYAKGTGALWQQGTERGNTQVPKDPITQLMTKDQIPMTREFPVSKSERQREWRLRDEQPFLDTESGRGTAALQDLRRSMRLNSSRSVLECASPLALWHLGLPEAKQFRLGG